MKTGKKDWSLFNPPPERRAPRRPSHEPRTLEIIVEKPPPAWEEDGPNRPEQRSRFHRSKERKEGGLANNKSMISK